MVRNLIVASLLWPISLPCFSEEPDHEIHEELRADLQIVESAINNGDFDRMLPVLSEKIRATPVNQEFLASHAEVSAYFKKWFGQGGYLKKLEFKLTPDTVTELSADKTWGVVYGNGGEKYVLSDGRPYELKTRWTAIVAKEDDGQWRIRGIHLGTNFLDNPILSEAEHALGKAAAAGGAIGLPLGVLLGWLFFRKKKS